MIEEQNPFRSPATPPPAPLNFVPQHQQGQRAAPFASGFALALWTIVLLGTVAVSDFFGCWIGLSRNEVLNPGPRTSQSEFAGIDQNFVTIVEFNSLASLAVAVTFLMWTHRIYKNLPALGNSHPRRTPASAVAWYFVPLANMVMPYEVMAEIADGSDPAQLNDLHYATSPLVRLWWGSFLVSNLVAFFVVLNLCSGAGPPDLLTLALVNDLIIAAFALEFFAAIFAILLVHWVDKCQQARYVLLITHKRVETTNARPALAKIRARRSERRSYWRS